MLTLFGLADPREGPVDKWIWECKSEFCRHLTHAPRVEFLVTYLDDAKVIWDHDAMWGGQIIRSKSGRVFYTNYYHPRMDRPPEVMTYEIDSCYSRTEVSLAQWERHFAMYRATNTPFWGDFREQVIRLMIGRPDILRWILLSFPGCGWIETLDKFWTNADKFYP